MSFTPRIYVEYTIYPSLSCNEAYEMTPSLFHYLLNVLRLRSGEKVIFFNEKEGEWLGIIEQKSKHKAIFRIQERLREPILTKGPTLAFSLLKRDAMDLAIRMATELGVKVIQPLQMMRTNTPRLKIERLRSIAIEAAEQSNRLTVPQIKSLDRLFNFCENWPRDKTLWIAVERLSEKTYENPCDSKHFDVDDGILIGPEGGFDHVELSKLLQYGFVRPYSLGNLILKSETAVVASLAKWSALVEA